MTTPARTRFRGRGRQRGVAVIVAVLVVALATSTATYMLWHQSLWMRQVENLTARAQADAIARAAANWAAAIIAEDDRAVDHLGEVWARPIPPFAAEAAQLAGAITDEQAKFNVNNLVRNGAASAADLVAFQRLLGTLGLPATLGEALVDWLDADDAITQPNGAEDAYYLALDPPYRAANRSMVNVAELVRVKGFTSEIVARLMPHVTALPIDTLVNVNTADATVLQAMVPTLAGDEAANIVATRKTRPYKDRSEFLAALSKPPAAGSDGGGIDVKSRFFSADITVRLSRVTVGYRAVLDRGDQGTTPKVIALSQLAL